MKKTIMLLLLTGSGFAGLCQQSSKAVEYAATITAGDLSKHLHIIASDSLQGRETGEKGQKMAANYIAGEFFDYGLQPVVTNSDNAKSYYQPFELVRRSWGEVFVETAKGKKEFLKDFFFLGDVTIQEAIQTEVVFVGYGIETDKYSDYNDIDVAGKTVLIWSGEPKDKKGNSLVSGTSTESEWAASYQKKAALARQKGASYVIVVTKDQDALDKTLNNYRNSFMHPTLGFPDAKKLNTGTMFVSPSTAADILNVSPDKLKKQQKRISRRKKPSINPASITIKAERKEAMVGTENVLGLVEGTDKKDEIIVVTAHYDHEGIKDGKIYNGADDDGSGTVAVIELAQAFTQAKIEGNGPRRSMLFMTVTAEEKGLLGSDYYTRNPVFPLQNTVANLNIDMIGRVDKEHEGNPDYIYVIGSDKLSSELHKINEDANASHTRLKLDYTYNDPNDPNRFYYRSDHYNFAKNRIPVVFYFNGVHEDYHQPGDDVEKINFQKMEKITRLVFHTAWELANRDQRIVVDSNKQ
ncbi:M28 family peptidase [Rhodocytophaga rosea]|uniref:M28 family peptidase n=1 Tax=Rhodocytophaga rosea TaxID=2704465 RepID=A0A6C0GQX6_9BACT|nr:M28 family peptidase [Rhodocytophaga rosea]QHT70264.1 M28 family peptidase [Rhodocytophaga rosea]